MSDNPNVKIASKSGTVKAVQYPANGVSNAEKHITQFKVVNYKKDRISSFDTSEVVYTIRLPMPPKLGYGDAHEYEEFSATLLANLAAGIQGDSTLKEMAAVAGASVLGKVLGADMKLIQGTSEGKVINPRAANLFKTPKARQMQFEYSLVAKNKKESEDIHKIITLFRSFSYPNVLYDEQVYTSPQLFIIDYLTLDNNQKKYYPNKYLPKPLPAALVAMNVDYYSFGEPALHVDNNAPVEVKLSLIFLEMEIDNKEKLRNRYGDLDLT